MSTYAAIQRLGGAEYRIGDYVNGYIQRIAPKANLTAFFLRQVARLVCLCAFCKVGGRWGGTVQYRPHEIPGIAGGIASRRGWM